MPTLLVNDGYGVNQVIYMLAQLLAAAGAASVLLEEPEVHLHPTVVRKLRAGALLASLNERRQASPADDAQRSVSERDAGGGGRKGSSNGEDLRIFFCTKEGRYQQVRAASKSTPTGQIEGGLRGFIEAELEDLRTLLGL
jgi:hypothetical protein